MLVKEMIILTLVKNGKEDFIQDFRNGEKSGSTPNTEKTAGNLSPRIRLEGINNG